MDITLNLTHLPIELRHSVCNGLHHEDVARYKLGLIEQARMKRLLDQVMVPGANTDIGKQTMFIGEDQAHRIRRQYGQLCFADPDFGKFLLKHHPDFRVKDVGTRVQSGWTAACAKNPKSKIQTSKLAT